MYLVVPDLKAGETQEVASLEFEGTNHIAWF